MATPVTDYVNQLLNRYTLPALICFLKDVEPLLNDQGRAQIAVLESQYASRPPLSFPTVGGWSLRSPLPDRPPSGMGCSDTSSISEGFHSTDTMSCLAQAGSDTQSPRERVHGPRPDPGHRVSKGIHKPTTPRASSPLHAGKKIPFECPYCAEVMTPSPIARKWDLKRHFMQFHQTDAQWLCPERGCGMAFDWKSAFELHLKQAHRGVHRPPDEAMVKLCPQVVFACGFTNCKQVFEAPSAQDARRTAKEYFNHVVKHFDDNLTHRNWSYSTRFRNLLRQRAVAGCWKNLKKEGGQYLNPECQWQPHTSSVLRKLLETRHLPDVTLLVQWAAHLGSKPFSQPWSDVPKLPAKLRLPLEETCNLALEHHHGLGARPDRYRPSSGIEEASASPANSAERGEDPAGDSEPVPYTGYLAEITSHFPMPPPFQAFGLELYSGAQQPTFTSTGPAPQPVCTPNDASASHIPRQPVLQWPAYDGQPTGLAAQSPVPGASYVPEPIMPSEYRHQVLRTDGNGIEGVASPPTLSLGTPREDFEMGDCPRDPDAEYYD